MHQFFVNPEQIQGKCVVILGKDVNHIKNVLRMKTGDEIAISNGVDEKEYRCSITKIEEEQILLELLFVKEEGLELSAKLYLFQGLPKSDKMEFIIQKAVELGVHEVIPISTRRSVVKLDDKKAKGKVVRWQQIAEAAAKQSKRKIVPLVKDVCSMKQAIDYARTMDIKLIPYELAEDISQTKHCIEAIKPQQSVAIFIGPEGGFEEAEIQLAIENQISPITLGKRILRTETAGMAVLAIIMYHLES